MLGAMMTLLAFVSCYHFIIVQQLVYFNTVIWRAYFSITGCGWIIWQNRQMVRLLLDIQAETKAGNVFQVSQTCR